MRIQRIRLTLFYNSFFAFVARTIALNLLVVIIIYGFIQGNFPQIPVFLLSILIILEIFIRFEIEKIAPVSSVSNPKYILDSFTKRGLESVLFKKNTRAFLNYVLKFPSSKFLLQKAVIDRKDLVFSPVSQEAVMQKAFEIAKKQNGKFVTSTDLLVAYLLITENQSKVLFNAKLKEEDVLNIASWARITFDEENPKEIKARFVGIGAFETLVWGWTPETKNYTRDLTFSNVKKHSLISGREKEYAMLIETMQKDQNNNVMLVGEVGTGKENLVENFIYESYEAVLPKKLNHRRFLELMLGPFVAGTADRSDLETRLQSIIEEVKHSGNVVLYIPEFQNLLGSSSYNVDLSGAILPYLKDGKMPIIGSMTSSEYKKFFENSGLSEVFSIITLEEPSPREDLKMLFQKTEEIELQNKAKLSYRSIVAAAEYGDKYQISESMPGSSIDLLTDAANSVRLKKGKIVLEEDVLQKVEEKSHIPVGQPKQEEKNLLLDFEAQMHKFIIGQIEAVRSISEAMRRIRAGLARQKPISFLFLGPTGVGKTETAKTLARLYFKGEAHIIRLDMSEYGTPESLSRLLQSGSQSFLDQVESHPFSLILLDEFEKANEKILNLFLQVFDDARMTDVAGKTISFTNTIIIATSNAGSELIRETLDKGMPIETRTLLDYLQKNALFSPELLNRFDEIVVFKPLTEAEILEVTRIMLSELIVKMSAQDVTLSFDENATAKIARGGFNSEFGARPLRRYIQDNIEDVIAKKLLNSEIVRGDKLLIDLDQSSNFTFSKSS